MGISLIRQPGTGSISSVAYSIYGSREGGAGTDAALGHGPSGNQAPLTVQVFQGDTQQCIQDVCGVYAFQNDNTGNLSRLLPASHPYWPWLYGSRLTGLHGVTSRSQLSFNLKSQGLVFPAYDHMLATFLFQQPKYGLLTDAVLDANFPPVSVNVTVLGDTTNGSPTVQNVSNIGFCLPGTTISGAGFGGGTKISTTDSATQFTCNGNAGSTNTRATLTLSRNVRQEWNRFTFVRPSPASEVLTMEGGTLYWSEGGAAPKPTAGTAFNSPLGQFLAKPDLLMIWYQVPFYGLYSPTTRLPELVMQAANCVNSQPFLGKPAGTLLLKGYDFHENEAPYGPLTSGVLPGPMQFSPNSYWPSLTVDVMLQFSHFDPPHANSTGRGHNLAPNRGTIGTPNSGDFQWYRVDTKGDGTGTQIFPTFDFRAIFSKCA